VRPSAAFLAALTFLLAAAAAFGGLGWLLTNLTPTRPMAIIAAYVFGFVAISSSVSLLVWLARRPRSEDGQLKSPAVYIGHAMVLSIIILFAMWLQALRTLTPVAALLLIGLYAVLELAVLFGTRGSVELPIRR
jgi:drug/metabolite transporter (DMT)-like permease